MIFREFYMLVLISFLAVLLSSCTSRLDESVEGRYVNQNDKTILQHIDIKENGEYQYFYKNLTNGEVVSHVGIWSSRKGERFIEVSFEDWIEIGGEGDTIQSYSLLAVKLKDGELHFSYDLPSKKNFRKMN